MLPQWASNLIDLQETVYNFLFKKKKNYYLIK